MLKMTKLEMQGLLLAAEVESNILTGVPLTTNLILALNRFRQAQQEAELAVGAELEDMYRRHLEAIECPVVELSKLRKS
jgi:hypothetical protein